MIKYIGSKRTLIPQLQAAFTDLPSGSRVLDLFTGTSRVAQGLKQLGLSVHANDHNRYAWMNARCYIEVDRAAWLAQAKELIAQLSSTAPAAGWFTEHYCQSARFFHPDNGAKIEAIRNQIDQLKLGPELRAIALVSLMEAADRVDSTVGVQMAFLKQWAGRANKPLQLRVPELQAGQGSASCMEAVECAGGFEGSAAYLDPPYNQHNYRANYHIWETLIHWDCPEVYGIVNKRMDCREKKSDFNSKVRIKAAFEAVIAALDVERIVVSFSDEGFLTKGTIEDVLSAQGHVCTVDIDYKRYVGAKIGIHDLKGQAVGTVSHLRNQERIFIMDRCSAQAEAAAERVKKSRQQPRSR